MKQRTFSPSLLRSAIAAVALVLGGCTMAPDHQRPAALITPQFPGQTASEAQNGVIFSDIGWRNYFTDPALQQVISQALEHNSDLRKATLRIEEARALYGIQRADLLPNLSASGQGTRARSLSGAATHGETAISEQYAANLALASYEIDFFGRIRSLKDVALNSYLATIEARRAAHIALVSQVANSWLIERQLAEQLDVAQRTLKTYRYSYQLINQQVQAGLSSELDLIQAKTQVDSAEVQVASLTRQHEQATNALTLLVGAPLAVSEKPYSLTKLKIADRLPIGMPSEVLTIRPDVVAAEYALKSANANIGAARAAFFPSIRLVGSVGSVSGDLSDLFSGGTRAWSFMPSISIPIFQGGRNMANLDLAEVRKNIEIINYENAVKTAFREVADALVARDELAKQVKSQLALRNSQAKRLKLANSRYENGLSSYLDVLDAQRALFGAEQDLLSAYQLKLANAVKLYVALGGGWIETSNMNVDGTGQPVAVGEGTASTQPVFVD